MDESGPMADTRTIVWEWVELKGHLSAEERRRRFEAFLGVIDAGEVKSADVALLIRSSLEAHAAAMREGLDSTDPDQNARIRELFEDFHERRLGAE